MQLDLGAVLCSKQKVSRILTLESMYKIGDENLHHLSQTKSVSVTWKFAAKFETLSLRDERLARDQIRNMPTQMPLRFRKISGSSIGVLIQLENHPQRLPKPPDSLLNLISRSSSKCSPKKHLVPGITKLSTKPAPF